MSFFKDGNLSNFFAKTINAKTLLKFVFFNESPFSGHLWYLGAIIYVLFIAFILNRVFPTYGMRILYWLTPFLLLTDLLFGKYSLLFFQKEYPILFVRNFLCVGIPYFTIGCFLREYDREVKPLRSKPFLILLLTILCVLTTIAESCLLNRHNLSASREHYISTTFLSVLVFIVFTSRYWNGKMTLLFRIGKNHAAFIYIIHPIVIAILSAVMSRLPIDEVYLYVRPIIVYLFSILTSILFMIIKSKIGNNSCHLQWSPRIE